MKKTTTSWEKSSQWYHSIVGKEGHYYHQKIILPNVLRLLDIKPGDSLLDIGCGQGILARHMPSNVSYRGVDLSSSLIQIAKKEKLGTFYCTDATKKLPFTQSDFTHATAILSLQNMEHPGQAIKNMSTHLKKEGKALIVLNHPCFRIPRQTEWAIDENKKIQYRRIDHYTSPLKIPILMHPGNKNSDKTWSFHFPMSYWFNEFYQASLLVENLEEWHSDKISTGPKAKMENRARKEFPLFLAITLTRK